MRKVLAAVAIAMGLGLAGVAHAEPGFVNGGVNVRAGPGVDFPRVTTLARGALVDIRGCIEGRQWCDVSFRGGRGWVSARYLNMDVGGRRAGLWDNRTRVQLPTLAWNLNTYWDENYSNSDFNRDRARYRNHGPRQTPAPQPPANNSAQSNPRPHQNSPQQGQPSQGQPTQGQANCDDPRTSQREQCEPQRRP